VDPAAALLPLLSSSSLLRSLEEELLGLRDLEATARFRLGPVPLLDLRDARAGVARIRGYLLVPDAAHGAFLLKTPTANLGIRVTPRGTELAPLSPDDWLEGEVARARGAHRRPDRDKSPQSTD
jgi:hypothetical protein